MFFKSPAFLEVSVWGVKKKGPCAGRVDESSGPGIGVMGRDHNQGQQPKRSMEKVLGGGDTPWAKPRKPLDPKGNGRPKGLKLAKSHYLPP